MRRAGDFAFLAVVTIFLPLMPVAIETQPIIACIFILMHYAGGRGASVRFYESRMMSWYMGIFLLYSLVGLFYNGVEALVTFVKVAIPLLFFIALTGVNVRISERLILAFISLHFFVLILVAVGYADVMSLIYDRFSAAKGDELGNGLSYFSPEPGYAAMYLFAAFIAVAYGLDSPRRLFYCWILLLLVVSTKSAFGFVLALVGFFLVHGWRFLTLCALAFPFLLALLPDDFRILHIARILENIDKENFILSFVLLEPSGATRLLKNIPSAYYGVTSFWGYGVGSFQSAFAEIASGIDVYREHPLLREVYESGGAIVPDSFFSLIAFETGAFSLIYIASLFVMLQKMAMRRRRGTEIFAAFCVIVLFTLQSQISSPILLYVMYCMLYGEVGASTLSLKIRA
jgi:hypothetical protein